MRKCIAVPVCALVVAACQIGHDIYQPARTPEADSQEQSLQTRDEMKREWAKRYPRQTEGRVVRRNAMGGRID